MFKINKRFQELHRALSAEEYKELEASIKAEGINDPLIIWKDQIVDGHHRNKIAKKLGIEPPFKVRTFDDEDAVEKWILRLQLGRRNLSPLDFKLAVGRLYNVEKQEAGGDKKSKAENKLLIGSTAEKIATETGVSHDTVKRNGKYATAFDKLPKAVKTLIEEQPSRATEAAVIKMATMEPADLTQAAREVRVGNAARFDDIVKPAKKQPASPQKPNPASASIVHDELGRDVIDDLRDQHGMRAALKSLGGKIDPIRREVEKLAQELGGEWLESSHIGTLLKDAKRAITTAAFYCECPQCQREWDVKCKRCDGTGYIPERSKGLLSDEEKAWLLP